jgi:hypothetical protein
MEQISEYNCNPRKYDPTKLVWCEADLVELSNNFVPRGHCFNHWPSQDSEKENSLNPCQVDPMERADGSRENQTVPLERPNGTDDPIQCGVKQTEFVKYEAV